MKNKCYPQDGDANCALVCSGFTKFSTNVLTDFVEYIDKTMCI